MDKTALKALHVLEALVSVRGPCGVSELARQVGLPKSNVHRVLTTLESAGYVRRAGEGAYAPSLKLWELGTAVMLSVDLRPFATPHMRRLVQETRESAILAVLDGADVVYVDKIESDQAIQAITRVGSRVPAYSVGTGKAMLAFSPSPLQADAARRAVAHTTATIVEEEALLAEFESIRKRGYAVNRGEFRDEVAGVAAPILDPAGQVLGGIGIWGPDQRLARKLKALGGSVVACATMISAELAAKHFPAAPLMRA